MSELYTNMAATALAQINDKGRTVTLREYGDAVYDPATDTFTQGSADDVIAKALFTKFKTGDVDGELIKHEDKRVLIAASGVSKPAQGSLIVDGSDSYRVINTDEIKPADTSILYMVQVRR